MHSHAMSVDYNSVIVSYEWFDIMIIVCARILERKKTVMGDSKKIVELRY